MSQPQQENNSEGKIVFSLYVIMFVIVIPTMIYFYSTYGGNAK